MKEIVMWQAPVLSNELMLTTPKKIDHGFAAGEWSLMWKCPSCGHVQYDSVDPDAGPWISCICEACQVTFEDHRLDPVSLKNWDVARDAASADSVNEEA